MKQRHSSVKDVQLKITGVLGTGAYGTVYRGEWQGLACAVKVVVFNGNHESRKVRVAVAAWRRRRGGGDGSAWWLTSRATAGAGGAV